MTGLRQSESQFQAFQKVEGVAQNCNRIESPGRPLWPVDSVGLKNKCSKPRVVFEHYGITDAESETWFKLLKLLQPAQVHEVHELQC
jgi:hypothetical protein